LIKSVRTRLAPPAGLIALLAALCLAPAAHAGATLSFSPPALQVAPGATFDVYVRVQMDGGSAFNAVGLRVGFDPSALTPVPLSPINNQIGPYMKTKCSNFFHVFHSGASVDSADCTMLCSNTVLTDSGRVYQLRFVAANSVRTTTLHFLPGTNLVNAGIYVLPLTTQDGAIGIGITPTLGVGDTPATSGLSLAIGPNPSRAGTLLSFGAALSQDASITVLDAQGRRIRSLTANAGSRAVWWDGRDGSGVRAAPGNYLLHVRHGDEQASVHVTVVR
jgi:hypothetical protein